MRSVTKIHINQSSLFSDFVLYDFELFERFALYLANKNDGSQEGTRTCALWESGFVLSMMFFNEHGCTRARTNYIREPRTTNRLFFFLDLAQFMKMSIDNDNLCVSCLPIKSPSASVVGLIVRRQCHLVDVTPLPNSALEFRKREREIYKFPPRL